MNQLNKLPDAVLFVDNKIALAQRKRVNGILATASRAALAAATVLSDRAAEHFGLSQQRQLQLIQGKPLGDVRGGDGDGPS